jgi:hypothetical protein
VSLANLKQCAQLQHVYAGDWKGSFVNPFDPNAGALAAVPWYAMRDEIHSTQTQVVMWNFGEPNYATLPFATCWLSVATQYITPSNLASRMMYAPNDTALIERFQRMFPQESDIGNYLWDSTYWASPTLWLSTEPFSSQNWVPIRLIDSKYLRRNRLDDAVYPSAKAMVFERFDFTRKDRAHAAGGREPFHPMFNNPEATTRLAVIDGSVTSVKLATLYRRIDPASSSQADVDTYTPAGSWAIPDSVLGDSSMPVGGSNHWNLGRDALENGDGSMLGIAGGFSQWPAFFWGTRQGIRGRDIPR